MPACFVTGTGTDVGKSFVTASLLRRLIAAGRDVSAVKPVVSGFDPAHATTSDPGILLAALQRAVTESELDRIAPWRFAAPLSPDMAAAREGRVIDFAALVDFSRAAIAKSSGFLLIEGVGGIMVPLDSRRTVLDWMVALRLPVLLVAGSYLGTISHSLSAIAVLRAHGLEIASLVVSETEGSTVSLDETVATIGRFAATTETIAVPRGAPPSHPAFARLEALLSC
jgi:dethiobiotin synthetase